MTGFLEQRRDWQIDKVRSDRDKGILSEPDAMEQVVLINERYGKARKWKDNNA